MGKIHVVFVGRNPGLYDTWEEARDQVDGFRNAKYRSFKTREEAQDAFSKYQRDQVGSSNRGKIYVVFVGRQPGLYTTWEAASAQVTGFSNATHRSFETREDAERAFAKFGQLNVDIQHASPAPAPVHDSAEYKELECKLDKVRSERDFAFDVAGAYAEMLARLRNVDLSD